MSFEAGTSAVNFEMNCATGVLTIHHDVPKMLDLILSSHQKNAFSSDSSSENGLRIGSACGSSSRQNQAVETVSKIEHMFGLQVVQGLRSFKFCFYCTSRIFFESLCCVISHLLPFHIGACMQ